MKNQRITYRNDLAFYQNASKELNAFCQQAQAFRAARKRSKINPAQAKRMGALILAGALVLIGALTINNRTALAVAEILGASILRTMK